MRRFAEIEGLRAWLAWSVVTWHLLMFSGLDVDNWPTKVVARFSSVAVDLFIIISGFVIAHLVTTRREPWRPYITRRFFRIYPNYLLVAIVSAFTTALAASAMRQASWDAAELGPYYDGIQGTFASQQEFLGWHVFAHLPLLQGVVPDSVLPYSSAVFLGPAWSLSLEWQFYLMAPFLVATLLSKRWRVPLFVLALAGLILFDSGILGEYRLRSLILAASYLFAIGILSRLYWDRIRIRRVLLVACAVSLTVAGVPAHILMAPGLWAGFLYFMMGTTDRSTESAPQRAWRVLFGGRVVRYLGERSYSVYIAHWPIVQTAMWLVVPRGASQWEAVAWVSGLTVPTTLLASAFLFRFVEKPAMRLGSRLANRATDSDSKVVPRTELVQP